MTKLSKKSLKHTPMLDFNHPQIQSLIEQRKWRDLSLYDANNETNNLNIRAIKPSNKA